MITRLLFTLILCIAAPAFAQEANRFAATMIPPERFEVGATQVERHGQGRVPVVLIPGLASGAWAWQSAARELMKDHTVYVLTLPGFDGRPAVADKGLAAARDALRELIDTRKLARPVLIGHSLGGTMAIGFAAQHPDLVRGVASLDGLPIFPGTEDLSEFQRKRMSMSLGARMAGATPAMFAAQQQEYMRGIGVVDMARADELAKLSSKSDPEAVSRYMAEAIAVDLREQLPKIKAPVLILSPYFQVDADQLRMTEEAKTAYYTALMDGTPNVKVKSIGPARHFAMFDQPQMVNDALRDFIQSLP
jgi:pimeloyl-ACP methyl ester carboxylesterase